MDLIFATFPSLYKRGRGLESERYHYHDRSERYCTPVPQRRTLITVEGLANVNN